MSSTEPLPSFGTLPPTASKDTISPFQIAIPDSQLTALQTLLELSPLPKPSYENTTTFPPSSSPGAPSPTYGAPPSPGAPPNSPTYGVPLPWLTAAKRTWLDTFSWRTAESRLNRIPQFKARITDDDGHVLTLHFAALFSQRADAVPIVRSHGWPCTFAEFLPVLELLMDRYTPATLPFHVVCPSLPGYTFSDAPPVEHNWTVADSARMTHKLMVALGFGSGKGYVAQGGDIGAAVSRVLGATYGACRAVHLNYNQMPAPADAGDIPVSEAEKRGVERMEAFMRTGTGYGIMHGTRAATVGEVLSASPLALLAWVGEKYLAWSDPKYPVPLDVILREVSLYWFTECVGTGLYPYREDFPDGERPEGYLHGQKELWIGKRFGVSMFPWDLCPVPRGWAERTGRLGWWRAHEDGGHFPAIEKPEVLLGDLEDFMGWVREEEAKEGNGE